MSKQVSKQEGPAVDWRRSHVQQLIMLGARPRLPSQPPHLPIALVVSNIPIWNERNSMP